MYRYYLRKGHTLKELQSLSTLETMFMIVCMDMDSEQTQNTLEV